MKNFTHNYNLKFIALAVLAIFCITYIGFMPKINADSQTYLIYDQGLNPNDVRSYKTQDDQIAYCFDANLATASSNGTPYNVKPQEVDPEVSYLMLIGYPTTTYINNTSFNNQEAYLITQTAIWMMRGYIDYNGVVTEKSGRGFYGDVGEIPDFISHYGDTILNGARYLVDQANEHGANSQIPAEMRSKLYIPDSNSYQRMLIGPKDPWGRIKLNKKIRLPKSVVTSPDYDMTQIEFEVYKNNAPTGKVFKLKSANRDDANYFAYDKDIPSHDYIDLTPGFYKLVEKNLPNGIKTPSKNEQFYVPAFTGDKSIKIITLENEPKIIKIETLINKIEKSSSSLTPLKDAEFEVKFSNNNEERTWILSSDEQGKVVLNKDHLISGDDFFSNDENENILPLGTLTIKEIKAPNGYALDEEVRTLNLSDYIENSKPFEAITIENKPIRADIKFEKKDGNTKQSLAYVPFKLTNTKTGESHIIFTNAKGEYNSELVKHSDRTNNNDSLDIQEIQKGIENLNETQCGLWFEGTNGESVDDSIGSLPYGTYTIEELRGETNSGYELISLTFDVNKQGMIDLGEILNWRVGLKTHLSADMSKEETYILSDKISYSNLPENNEYKIVTSFVVVNDNGGPEPLIVNGEHYIKSTTFTSQNREGEIIIDNSIPKANLTGKTVVAYEDIYQGDELIASHRNPLDKDQTIEFEKEKTIHKTGYKDLKNGLMAMTLGFVSLIIIALYKKERDVW